MSVLPFAREDEPLHVDWQAHDETPGEVGPGACGLGVCCAEAGHAGTCDEASGWDDATVGDLLELPTARANVGFNVLAARFTAATPVIERAAQAIRVMGNVMTPYTPSAWREWSINYNSTWSTTTTWNISVNTTTATGVNYDTEWINVPYTRFTQPYDELWGKWGVRDQPIPQVQDEMRERRRIEMQRQRDELQAQREAQSRRRLAAQPLLAQAKERAEELLELILTPQEKIYRDQHDGQILVTGSETGNLYTVDTRYHGVHGNIRQVDEHGCVLAVLCVAPQMSHQDEHGDRYGMPLADGFVGQILSLKANEPALLAKANFSGRRECAHRDVPILRAS